MTFIIIISSVGWRNLTHVKYIIEDVGTPIFVISKVISEEATSVPTISYFAQTKSFWITSQRNILLSSVQRDCWDIFWYLLRLLSPRICTIVATLYLRTCLLCGCCSCFCFVPSLVCECRCVDWTFVDSHNIFQYIDICLYTVELWSYPFLQSK